MLPERGGKEQQQQLSRKVSAEHSVATPWRIPRPPAGGRGAATEGSRGLGFLPDADGFAHYAETHFGTLCWYYAGDFCAHYAGVMPKISKTAPRGA